MAFGLDAPARIDTFRVHTRSCPYQGSNDCLAGISNFYVFATNASIAPNTIEYVYTHPTLTGSWPAMGGFVTQYSADLHSVPEFITIDVARTARIITLIAPEHTHFMFFEIKLYGEALAKPVIPWPTILVAQFSLELESITDIEAFKQQFCAETSLLSNGTVPAELVHVNSVTSSEGTTTTIRVNATTSRAAYEQLTLLLASPSLLRSLDPITFPIFSTAIATAANNVQPSSSSSRGPLLAIVLSLVTTLLCVLGLVHLYRRRQRPSFSAAPENEFSSLVSYAQATAPVVYT